MACRHWNVRADFNLPGVDGKDYSLNSFKTKQVVVVMFTCNHCPYAQAYEDRLISIQREYAAKRVQLVAINANDEAGYPEDGFENMVRRSQKKQFNFPYLRDESQDVALKYGALRTPHFYVFDAARKLIYTGRGIDSPRDASRMTVNDLANALEQHLAGRPVAVPVTNPIGCNVKWEGQDAHWMPPDACDLV